MTENDDEKILARAKIIQEERGVGLTDAMIIAEGELSSKSPLPESFTVEITVKPRVARWILNEFAATATHTTEQRIAAYLNIVLNRARVVAARVGEDVPDIGAGGAVTMRRADFQRKVGQ